MKRIAEMSDLNQVIRTLPRIKKHLLNPDNMRWVHITPADMSSSKSTVWQMSVAVSVLSCFVEFCCLCCRNCRNLTKWFWYIRNTISHLLSLFLYRCAVNTTPQKMSDTAAQLESFMKEVAGNRKERKPVRTTVVEVSTGKPVRIFVMRTCRPNQNIIFFFLLWCFFIPSLKRPLDHLDDSGPSRKLISVSSVFFHFIVCWSTSFKVLHSPLICHTYIAAIVNYN